MRICVDATSLLLRSAGVKNYVYHWMLALQREAKEHVITAYPLLGEVGDLNHESSVLSSWQTLPRLALLHIMNVRLNPGLDYLMRDVDVFHASNQIRNPPKRTKLTGTLYDMTCLLMPQNHTSGNVRAEQNFAEKVLTRAHGLISISQSTKNDAVRLLRLDPERISVIYPGVPQSFFDVTRSSVAAASAKYRLDKPYILFVGTVEPRKNLDTLLDAYEQLPVSIGNEFDLVTVGPTGWAAGSTVHRLSSGMPGLRPLGYIPEADLPGNHGRGNGFRVPIALRRFRFPGGAVDGCRGAGDHVQRFVPPGSGGRRGGFDRSAQRQRASRGACPPAHFAYAAEALDGGGAADREGVHMAGSRPQIG